MTTLVGIKAESANSTKGIILGSDMSGTQTSWTPQGDIAYRNQRRIETQKIYVDKNKELAVCMSGVFDRGYKDFLSGILEGDINFQKVIEQGDFPELRSLNLSRMEGRTVNPAAQSGLLIATRYGEPQLYSCWPLGRVEMRDWTSIGSGSDYALNYIGESNYLIPRGITLSQAIDLAVTSLDKASQDIYTGGLDLVVVTNDDIYDLGSGIRKDIETARAKSLEKIKRKFKK